MEIIIVYLAMIFGCGLIARVLRLPALIGFLAAGFALNLLGVPEISQLGLLSDIGVTLMLFAIGLRLDIRSLLRKEIWLTAGAHMVLMVGVGTGFILLLSLVGAFGPESLGSLAVLGLIMSFSSTIFVVKILQDRGDEEALYGRICIGVLIMQDIAAVVIISISRGTAPSLLTLGLIFLIPVLGFVVRDWHRLGHGEMGALFGITMALIPGYALFEWLNLSGSLGALVMGLVLAPKAGSEQLSHTLFTVKELLLVGFFVSLGFRGIPTLADIGLGLLLLLLLPIQALLYWGLLWAMGLRNRTGVLSALLLSNYSEFALIVAALGIEGGWLADHWLPALVIAVSVGFVVASVANPRNTSQASRIALKLPARPPHKIHPEDRPVEIGQANALVLGMGRVGQAAYEQLRLEHGRDVLGVEHDPKRVHALQNDGVNVIEGDATDAEFWTRIVSNGLVRIVVLAMPAQHANIDALRELRRFGYEGTVAATALYREDVEELNELGLDVVIHLYAGAGESLADRAAEKEREHEELM